MFTSTLNEINKFKFIDRNLLAIIDFSRKLIINCQDTGKYEINEDAFIIIADDYTDSPDKKKWEVHEQYIDIQILLNGIEYIGFTNSSMVVEENYLNEKDIAFGSIQSNENILLLEPGALAIFYPGEPHRPLCSKGKRELVKKAIVKVHKRALDK
ncbi:TPA: YhcH/YjgK/YiaL family protein [Escherichia coli]|nr:YhcH/YjgK/YiaL family protein [Escherichia coli]HEL8044577.1 YhcH/YjgK/YiaL family protein [Escherichia coli]HEL8049339.1 YhcH/YjgK/YiaL family protein [Escherichia coli]HEL8054100.1 YhcH/YjgK/YiaL family protein [Escherichia coli]HEL8058959.1 YhcH/YjgK/YiaL family protein [Escherichia coli]